MSWIKYTNSIWELVAYTRSKHTVGSTCKHAVSQYETSRVILTLRAFFMYVCRHTSIVFVFSMFPFGTYQPTLYWQHASVEQAVDKLTICCGCYYKQSHTSIHAATVTNVQVYIGFNEHQRKNPTSLQSVQFLYTPDRPQTRCTVQLVFFAG